METRESLVVSLALNIDVWAWLHIYKRSGLLEDRLLSSQSELFIKLQKALIGCPPKRHFVLDILLY